MGRHFAPETMVLEQGTWKFGESATSAITSKDTPPSNLGRPGGIGEQWEFTVSALARQTAEVHSAPRLSVVVG